MSAPDPVFEAYVRAPAAAAAAALERVVAAALPAVRDVCRGAAGIGRDDAEDAAADALAHVIARVRQLRDSGGDANAIQNVAAYAAVTARRVCADRLRRAHPMRARLASRVRYALAHDPALRLRRTDTAALAGLAAWPDTRTSVSPAVAARAAADLQPRVEGTALLTAIREVLERAGGWLEVSALISALFDGAGLKDPAFTPADDVDLPAPATPVDPEEGDGARARLGAVWQEIATLPARQRAALLLNLRDETGRSGLPLFVLAGIATLASLAAALELAPADLAALWPSLPFDDLRIAERLGLTRQQVINLRKSARARLSRRLTASSLPVVIQGTFGRQIKRKPS